MDPLRSWNETRRKIPSYIQPRDPSVDRRFRPCPDRQIKLENVFEEEADPEMNGINIDLTNEDPATLDTVSVFLRIRPHEKTDMQTYRIQDKALIVKCEEMINNMKRESIEKHFYFNGILNSKSSQHEVYETCIRPHLEDVTIDSGSTFLTYGTSGSGKTHTLLGSETQPGIIPRALEQIFTQNEAYIATRPLVKITKRDEQVMVLGDESAQKEIDISNLIIESIPDSYESYNAMRMAIQAGHDFKMKDMADVKQMNIWVSFVEIYNENIHDLLDTTSGRSHLRIISNDGDSYIKDVQWVFAATALDAYKIMKYGQQNISYGSTAINAASSRSHSIFFVNAVTITEDNEVSYSIYKFCDLAGSERVKKAESQGTRLKETQKINKSLMVLGRCLSAVHANQKAGKVLEIVPVRESKFTLLIQASLTGRERLSMIVNILPVPDYFDENMNVLIFSSTAKQILIKKAEDRKARRCSTRFSTFIETANASRIGEVDHLACEIERERLIDEIQLYKAEIAQLKEDMFRQEIILRKDIVDGYEDIMARRAEDNQRKLEMAKQMVSKQYELKLENMKKKYSILEEEYDELETEYDTLEDQLEFKNNEIKELKLRLAKFEKQLSVDY